MKWVIVSMVLFLAGYAICLETKAEKEVFMIDMEKTSERLQGHLRMLTQTIGERSVLLPKNLKKTQEYIEKFYQDMAPASWYGKRSRRF